MQRKQQRLRSAEESVTRCLNDYLGKGFYFRFTGTMGLAFGFGPEPYQWAPFFTGISSLVTAAMWICLSICVDNDAGGYQAVESSSAPKASGTSSAPAQNKQYTGPSAI